jgi:ABC-type sugar transport system substrate-binding protein
LKRLPRRALLAGAATAIAVRAQADESGPVTIAFANLSEDPSVRLEGTGFVGTDVRESFALAARRRSTELVFYDNALDRAKALANAQDAVRRHVDVYVHYGWDGTVNAEVGSQLAAAHIPVLAISRPVPGAPLYTCDNVAAGRIAGEALARHAAENWRDRPIEAVIIGPPSDAMNRLDERIAGITSGMKPVANAPTRLDTQGNPLKVDALLRSFLAAHTGRKVLVAALDDATALAAKSVIQGGGRNADAVIASHGCDRSVHGNASEKKELDPANRGSILLGSVGFFLDRYGYDVLPLAIDLAAGKPIAPRTVTEHRLVTPAKAFVIYPPIDMN